MYQMRHQVRLAESELRRAEATLANAQKATNYPQIHLEHHRAAVDIQHVELTSLRAKLAPLEANFKKVQAQKSHSAPSKAVIRQPQNPKKQKLEDSTKKDVSLTQPALATGLMVNTATPDVTPPLGGCALSADECQYDHLARLRRQYARPFELFCEEMDTVSDTCLTGICLAMPDMPWSIAVSRLAFILKSVLDRTDRQATPSTTQYLTAGTTIGCRQHVRFIRLAEIMVIQDWRDFVRWARHQSHVFNLCGQRSCIKLRHMCLEPVDCMASRSKCQASQAALRENDHSRDRTSSEAASRTPPTCNSSRCWPPCLSRHQNDNLLHSVAVEFAALHHVSFGPLTSVVKSGSYVPINEHQLGKLVHNEGIGLTFPFRKSYGHIFVDRWEEDTFVQVDTLLQIPPMYTLEEVQLILNRGLPSWTELPFNGVMSAIFWYARKRNMPFLTREGELNSSQSARWDRRSPQYRCPFCHGFDNFFDPADALVEKPADFSDFAQALKHMLLLHPRVPIGRKIRFLYEEAQACPGVCEAWKAILKGEYGASMASFSRGLLPPAIGDLLYGSQQKLGGLEN
ncbi:hypothetical protein NUW58_g10063 [Xylaria curta]|uniref:Uncharacterized protein n=1 Tax=Xylaria curta TaxID=42375 RepID=A0ACC1MS82_9PEZI|nr:hypothetical protein NUW58_g10063 [Xylaria curta]